MLSQKSLTRVQDTACKKAQVSSARTSHAWRYTNTFRNHGYNALAEAPDSCSHLLRSIWHTLATEEVEKVGKMEYCGSIRTLGLFQTKGKMCAKFGSDRFRNVNLCKVQTLSFILKLYEHKLYIYIFFFRCFSDSANECFRWCAR
jgi:hypothetical protein